MIRGSICLSRNDKMYPDIAKAVRVNGTVIADT
jgi:hypothetical protein